MCFLLLFHRPAGLPQHRRCCLAKPHWQSRRYSKRSDWHFACIHWHWLRKASWESISPVFPAVFAFGNQQAVHCAESFAVPRVLSQAVHCAVPFAVPHALSQAFHCAVLFAVPRVLPQAFRSAAFHSFPYAVSPEQTRAAPALQKPCFPPHGFQAVFSVFPAKPAGLLLPCAVLQSGPVRHVAKPVLLPMWPHTPFAADLQPK